MMRASVLPVSVAVLFAAAVAVSAQWSGPRSASEGVYTAQEAARGQQVYAHACAKCHGYRRLNGTFDEPPWPWQITPELTILLARQRGRSVGDLFFRIRAEGHMHCCMTLQMTADVVAFLLQQSGFPAGDQDLPTASDMLHQLLIDARQP